ncbi:MAG: MFS transporter [Paracoccaceae bacterium]
MNEMRRGFWAVVAMFALNGAFFGTWASRVPAVAEKFGLGPGALGLVLLAIGLGAVTSFPLAGRWSDQLGAARVTLALAAVHLAAVWLVALAPSVGLLAAALLLFGAMHGAMDVTMNAWAGEVERVAKRPIMPVFHAVWSLGAGLGAATGWVAVKAGVGIPLHFIAVGTVAGAVALAVARGPGSRRSTYTRVRRRSLPFRPGRCCRWRWWRWARRWARGAWRTGARSSSSPRPGRTRRRRRSAIPSSRWRW